MFIVSNMGSARDENCKKIIFDFPYEQDDFFLFFLNTGSVIYPDCTFQKKQYKVRSFLMKL